MNKSLVYAVNSASQDIQVNGTINFGNVVRRCGCNCTVDGGNAVIRGSGYYSVTTNITFEGTAAGTVVVTLYKDGVAIPGAVASATTADSTVYSITIPAIVRETCCCETSITAIVTGIAITVTNAAIEVIKT